MESTLKATVDELRQEFHKRMEAFETDLQKSSSPAAVSSGLAAEFAAYRKFISQSLTLLQQQIDALAHTVDTIETQRRRKMLLFHGVDEVPNENTTVLIADFVKQHFEMPAFQTSDIQRCHRMGRSSSPKKPRPILVKFRDVDSRDKVWFSKSKLKNSGVTLSEFLTKIRHDVFMAARERFGVTKCWTREGNVFVLNAGVRHKVLSLSQLHKISADSERPVPVTKIVVPKTRRATSVKK